MSDPLDMLSQLQRLEVEEMLRDPAAKERFVIGALVQVRDDVADVKNAKLPEVFHRLGKLERFKAWLCGVGAALVLVVGVIFAIWEALRK